MGSIADFVGGYSPPATSVSLTQRADLLAEHAQLKQQLPRVARDMEDGSIASGGNAEAQRIRDRIEQLEDEMAASEVVFTFTAMGRHEFMRLKAKHRPRREDRADGADFNMDTFPAALIAATCSDPTMTEDEGAELCERLSDGQFTKLWNAAIGVNVGDDSSPKSVRRSATTDSKNESWTTAGQGESLNPSS